MAGGRAGVLALTAPHLLSLRKCPSQEFQMRAMAKTVGLTQLHTKPRCSLIMAAVPFFIMSLYGATFAAYTLPNNTDTAQKQSWQGLARAIHCHQLTLHPSSDLSGTQL